MNNEILKKIRIPNDPGVYFFLKGKKVLYVGKATSLKDRIKSYFGKDLIETRGPLIADMIFKGDKINWQITDSVLEALILEASLIKKYQPKYNTKEKSDKSFNYVVITKEKFPKVIIIRERKLPEINNYKFQAIFGPFPNGAQLREALKIIRKIFPFLDDKSKNHYSFYKQVELVPDISSVEGKKQYKNNIKYIKLFLRGKKKGVINGLKKEMLVKAKSKEFERAGEIKRQLFALQHINDVALLKNDIKDNINTFRIESYDIAHMNGKNMVGVMTVIENNVVVKHEYKKFKIRTQKNTNDTGALVEVLSRRFGHKEWRYPDLVVVDGGLAQINAAEDVLNKIRVKVPVVSVLKDEGHKPKAIKGDEKLVKENKTAILIGNSEAHRFAITYHKNIRAKNFLK